MDILTLRPQIMEICDRELKEEQLQCIEVEWVGNEKILRIYIDFVGEQFGSPFEVDVCVRASRLLSELDAFDDIMPGAYHLEVTSPGVERPIRKEEHFRYYIGSLVKVQLRGNISGSRNLRGKISEVMGDGADQGSVSLLDNEETCSFLLSSLKSAKLEYNWSEKQI